MNRQIKEILAEELENSKKSLFKDINQIALDFTPDQLLHRDSEIKQLTHYFKQFISSIHDFSISEHGNNINSSTVFVLGGPSTGKTVTVKKFGLDLETWMKNSQPKIKFFFKYVNCIRYRTIYAIMITIIQSFVPNFPSRGFSTLELINYLKKFLETSNKSILLCLDGIDSLNLDKDYSILLTSLTNNDNDLDLSHSVSNRISLILISKSSTYLTLLDSSIRDHLEKNVIFFDDYSKEELTEIVEDRVKGALIESSWDSSLIQSIITRLTKNDPRLCFEILWRAVREAEKDTVTITDSHIERAFQDISPGINAYESIFSLRYQLKVFLYVLVQSILKKNNKDYSTIKEIQYLFSKYELRLKERMGIGYTSLYNYAQELHKLEILHINVTGKNRKGRKSVLKPCFKPNVLIDALNEHELFYKSQK